MAALCLLVLGSGCSPVKVHHDFDTGADFRTYATYDWLENRPGYSGPPAQLSDPIDMLVRSAVVGELVKKGYEENSDDPDVILYYHKGLGDQIDVSNWGYRYARTYWGWHGRGADVYTYRAGTLIVDLIDADTMTLAWRGAAQSTIDEYPTLEKARETIPEAVRSIFNGYPPAQ
ncbi:MAG: DUF4136 domain-containing protein [Candidatus Latescibacterota bacterium]|nr:MAG: DUF4136 domain-containing protein [Candidatus Latescibacterota bacterium]